MRRDECHVMVNMNVDKGSGRLKKRRTMKDNMSKKGLNTEMTADRGVWKNKTCCVNPIRSGS